MLNVPALLLEKFRTVDHVIRALARAETLTGRLRRTYGMLIHSQTLLS
jgi:hypothetical protein